MSERLQKAADRDASGTTPNVPVLA